MPRTSEEFEKSFVYKTFGFQFINFYGPLFYLAFIRGQFMAAPNEQARYRDRCEPSGCMIDVTIMLFVIMTGKQACNNFVELGVPFLQRWFKTRSNVQQTDENKYTRWERDYDLSKEESVPLFSDYLEMVIQYGFITMFVGAFPLAPLFALINNIIEIRVDAFKDLVEYQRFLPVRANNIGPWAYLLTVTTKIAILTNALLIAFSTDFIDKFIYNSFFEGTADTTASSYVGFRLSQFQTQDWCVGYQHGNETDLVTRLGENCSSMTGDTGLCYFRDYRERDEFGDYHRTKIWWTVVVGKLAFVFFFEHFIIVLQGLLQYLMPEVPDHVRLKQKRENFLKRQTFMKHEMAEVDRKLTEAAMRQE